MYLAISQGDVGLGKIGAAHPNILVLAAGGFGHVPIPLIKSKTDAIPLPDGGVSDVIACLDFRDMASALYCCCHIPYIVVH